MSLMGKVYLIGAGPGDPGLITVKGMNCVRRADVVVYDRLVSREILRHARPDAELIYVGKESSRHTMVQEEINQVLVDHARAGKTVARLKGGDPFVFGRGGEEAQFARENGVPFEIVPGVTSAIAAPAYAGIPVTHRDCTSTFAIVTGHEKPGKDESSIDWEKIATGIGTLVFLMGVENLPNIVQNLVARGRDPKTPVALIRWGTLPEQEVLKGTLETIVEKVRQAGFKPPAVTIVGDVVSLRDELRWFDNRPLFGSRIVVTRSRAQASNLVSALSELGAAVIEFPTIRIQPLAIPDLPALLKKMETYTWMIFTSVNGVDEFLRQIRDAGGDIRDLKGPKICAIGPATQARLQSTGLSVTAVPEVFRAEAVADVLRDQIHAGERVLVPRARGAREILPETLRSWGVHVDEVHVYEAVPEETFAAGEREQVVSGAVDWITFTSSSTVTNFVKLIGEDAVEAIRGRVKTACIGPITADTAKQYGFRVTVMPNEYTIDGLVNALAEAGASG